MKRFVILEHDWPVLHWDLMLEDDDRLLTWRILEEPHLDKPLPIKVSVDHRITYLDYTGPVSRGRGTVKSWDSGKLTSLTRTTKNCRAVIDSVRFKKTILVAIDAQKLILKTQ